MTDLSYMYKIFKLMPKPANLHIHMSGIVSYKNLLKCIEKTGLYKQMLIDYNSNLSFYQENPKTTYRSLTLNDIRNLKQKIQPAHSIKEMHVLGAIFYGLIKNKNFYKNYYLPLVIKKMNQHHVKYMQIRLKLGGVVNDDGTSVSILDELKILYKYQHYFSIIVQYNKCSNNIYDYFHKIITLVKGTKWEKFIVGYDLTGDEEVCRTLQFHYDKLLQLKSTYHINYYFHAGEVVNNPKSRINLEYAIKLKPIRIGHGLVAFDNPKLLAEIENNNIVLEICPISNKLIYNYKLDIHDIKKNINFIVIGSDDDNKLVSNITHDYVYLYHKGLSMNNIYTLLKNNIPFVPNYSLKEFDIEFNKFVDKYNLEFSNMNSRIVPQPMHLDNTMLNYIKSLSNQYYIGELLYKEATKKNILGNIGKEQYTKNKADDNFIKETYRFLKIDPEKYSTFLDICSNPNTHTLYVLDSNPDIKGTGISLQIEKGGYEPSKEISTYSNRYNIIYFDLLNDNFDTLPTNKVDYVTSECFVRHNIKNKGVSFEDVVQLNNQLQNKSLKLLSLKLKPKSDALILLPFHFDPIVFFNYLYVLEQMFDKITLYKSPTYQPNLSIVYIYCQSFNPNFDLDLLTANKILFDKDFVKLHIKDLDYVFMNINIGLIKSIKSA
jgi:adenosine deaminase